MKKTDIERIIKQGSTRQKIKLYFTDVAHFNIIDRVELKGSGDSLSLESKDQILTDKERDLIFNSIKEPKDKKYYNELRTWNKAFLMFKNKLSIDLMKLQAIFYRIDTINSETIERSKSMELVNDILDLIPDKKTREKALNKAIELTKGDGGIEYQEEGYPKYLDIDRSLWWAEVKKPTEMAIATAKDCKEYITMFKIILTDHLPLKPYKDWVEAQEKHLKTLITAIHETTILEDTPTDFPKIELYQEIVAEVTDEDIEDFKNAGI